MSVGYPDFERSVAWDGPILVNDFAIIPHGSPKLYGPFDVSHWETIQGFISSGGGPMQVWMIWRTQPVGGIITGQRIFNMDGANNDTGNFNVLNHGPWLTVQISALTGVSVDASPCLQASNRTHALDLVPLQMTLIDVQNDIALGAGAERQYRPPSLYSGPLDVWIGGGSFTIGSLRLYGMNTAGTFDFLSQHDFSAGNPNFLIQTPESSWHLGVINGTAGAVNPYIAAVGSSTGSS